MNNIEEFESMFDSDIDSRRYLESMRWQGIVTCPYCGSLKCCKVGVLHLYKCKPCNVKFSVTVGSVFRHTKLPIKTILYAMWIFIKSRKRITVVEIASILDIRDETALMLKEKLKLIFNEIDFYKKNPQEIFNEAIEKMFSCSNVLKREDHVNNLYHIGEVGELADANTYDRLLLYAKRRLFYCKWIYIPFATPQDILTETFIYMHDKNIKEYDANLIIKLINRTISRMWMDFVKAHPAMMEEYIKKRKDWKAEGRRLLKRWYLIQLEVNHKRQYGAKHSDFHDMHILAETKTRIQLKRKNRGDDFTDFISHFN